MNSTEIDLENVLTAEGVIPKDTPIVMLNLVRYKEHADYGERTDVAPCSGREAYLQHYVPAFNQVTQAEGIAGIQVLYLGTVLARVVGSANEEWDEIALVEYPSFAAFRAVTESPKYKAEAAHHRKAALEDWRLIATVKVTVAVQA